MSSLMMNLRYGNVINLNFFDITCDDLEIIFIHFTISDHVLTV